MENNLLTMLQEDDLKNAAKILALDSNDPDLTNMLKEVADYLAETLDDDIIDRIIHITTLDTDDQLVIIDNIIHILIPQIQTFHDDDDPNTFFVEDYIFELYEGIYNPIYNLFKSDEDYYCTYLVSWHIEYARYKYFFDEPEEAIQHNETAKKLCMIALKRADNKILSDYLNICYYNLGIIFEEKDNKKKALDNFSKYMMSKDSERFYPDMEISVYEDLADIYMRISDVCSKLNKAYYLELAYGILYEFYTGNYEEIDKDVNKDRLLSVLRKLAEAYKDKEDYEETLKYLELRYLYANEHLTKRPDSFEDMLVYMNAGELLLDFYILNSNLFEEKVIETKDENSGTISKKIQKPIGENKCPKYIEEYFDNVNSLFQKYNDEEIKIGYGVANLLYGKYYYFHSVYDTSSEYLTESKKIFKELLKDDPDNISCHDYYYTTLDYLRDISAFNDNMKEALRIVDEMIDLRLRIYKSDRDNEYFKDDLITAYQEAAEFCESYDLNKLSKNYYAKAEKLNN